MDNQHTLLLVDDEPFNLDILQEHLEDAGLSVITAENGEVALEILSRNEQKFSAILLDRMMPGMDGLEVLKIIKNSDVHRMVPVIIQTAAASDQDIADGLKAGAFYYLTKPFEPDLLLVVVSSAIADYENMQSSIAGENDVDDLLPLITEIRIELKSIDDAHRVIARLSQLYPDPAKVVLGMNEIIINAIEHGNLGISYEEKSTLLEKNRWKEEIEARLRDPKYSEKYVSIHIVKTDKEIRLQIADEGNGFDWRKYIDMSTDRVYDTHGRGIAMAAMISFDSVTYSDKGNEVMCIAKL